VQQEYDTQLRSGLTRSDEAVRAGAGVNPPYVLSVISRKIGTESRFNASIISVEGGYTIEGDSERYANMGDGIVAMDFLARRLSGQEITEQDRRRRASEVGSEVRALETEERIKAVSEATDKFLRSSGIVLGGMFGVALGGTGSRILSEDEYTAPPSSGSNGSNTKPPSMPSFMGGGLLELRLFRILGIQTGAQFLKDWAPVPGGDIEYVGISFVQIPVLARLTIRFSTTNYGNMTSGLGIGIFGGVGMNVAVTAVTASSGEASPGSMSAIFGVEGIVTFGAGELFTGYQGNFAMNGRGWAYSESGDFFDYDHGSHSLIMGFRYPIFFRR
jgi:hypothetical protein